MFKFQACKLKRKCWIKQKIQKFNKNSILRLEMVKIFWNFVITFEAYKFWYWEKLWVIWTIFREAKKKKKRVNMSKQILPFYTKIICCFLILTWHFLKKIIRIKYYLSTFTIKFVWWFFILIEAFFTSGLSQIGWKKNFIYLIKTFLAALRILNVLMYFVGTYKLTLRFRK